MRDVKTETAKLQYRLFMQLPQEKRLLIGLKMCEDAMKLTVSSVRNEFPNLNEKDFQRQMLLRLQRHNPKRLAWIE